MSTLGPRNKLTHAMLSLRSERNAPAWTTAGVYFALRLLQEKKSTFYCNSTHRSRACLRCAEIKAIAELNT